MNELIGKLEVSEIATRYTLRELYDICIDDGNEHLLDIPILLNFNNHFHTVEYINENSSIIESNGVQYIIIDTPYYHEANKKGGS